MAGIVSDQSEPLQVRTKAGLLDYDGVTFLMGPALCQLCQRKVWLTDDKRWCDEDGLGHSCSKGNKLGRRPWLTWKGWTRVSWSRK